MEAMLEQVLEGQQKMTVNFNGKLDSLYQDLNGKIESLNSHMKKLDVQVAQTAGAVQRQEGFLPGRTDINPKHQVNAFKVRNEKELKTVQKKRLSAEQIV